MAQPVRKHDTPPATYADLLQLPEHLTGEILNGELHTMPRPAIRHARASSVLSGKVAPTFDFDNTGSDGWLILLEPELHLGDKPHILVPDLAGWRRERLPSLPDTAWLELAPDWACEVLSPRLPAKTESSKCPSTAPKGWNGSG